MNAPGAASRSDEPDWDRLLDRACSGEGIETVLQPIVDLHRLVVVGYEALTRFGRDAPTPDRWFAAAAERGRVPELEAATLDVALGHRRGLPRNCFLTVNLEPESLVAPAVVTRLTAEGSLAGVVLELTEHRPAADPAALRAGLDRLRSVGALIAVDDAGSGYAGLQQLLDLRPSLLKLDRSLVEGLDKDEAKVALIEMMGVLAGRIDAWLLAEGVETREEAARLMDLGVPLAQGYLFARPAPPWADIEPDVRADLSPRRGSDRSAHGGLRDLLEVLPWVIDTELHDLAGIDDGQVVVVLDSATRRPVGVMDAAARFDEILLSPLIANVDESPAAVAHRLATRRPVDTSTPVVVVDNAGRYLGAVSVARVLVELARVTG